MLRINIDATKIESSERLTKLKQTRIEMEKVLNSEEFKINLLKIQKYGELSEWKYKTNEEIYSRIISGAENLDETKDGVINISLIPYFSWKRVIGYTYPISREIYFNTRYFDQRTTKLIGSTCLHEASHKMGFSHDFKRTKRRPFSISYQLNKAYEESYDEIFGKDKVSKVKVCTGFWIFKKCRWKYE